MGKGSNLTKTQRALRPVLNFLVERFFPQGAFYGGDYLTAISGDDSLTEKWGSTEMACVMFVVSGLRNQGVTHATFEASGITDKGVPVGSWRMTVEKIED